MTSQKKSRQIRSLVINFLIELLIYAGLVILYYLLALRLLASPLKALYDQYLPLYAVIALVLIVMQGMLLEHLTTYLLDRMGLKRFE